MPVLKNPKHERFAQELAKGKSASEAYVKAGYAKNDGNAVRLKGNEKVKARIEEIQDRVSEKAEWSAADRLRSLKTIHDANGRKDPRVAIAAISEANKMQGSYAPTKNEHSGPDGGPMKVQQVAWSIVDPDPQPEDSEGV